MLPANTDNTTKTREILLQTGWFLRRKRSNNHVHVGLMLRPSKHMRKNKQSLSVDLSILDIKNAFRTPFISHWGGGAVRSKWVISFVFIALKYYIYMYVQYIHEPTCLPAAILFL